MDALDVIAVLAPSAAFVVMAFWLTGSRAANQWRAREIKRRDDRIAQLTLDLQQADDRLAAQTAQTREWWLQAVASEQRALCLDTEARSN
ncbi:MAG: hypothetical protein ACRD0W_09660 [Acidimicrobiales bacterium]